MYLCERLWWSLSNRVVSGAGLNILYLLHETCLSVTVVLEILNFHPICITSPLQPGSVSNLRRPGKSSHTLVIFYPQQQSKLFRITYDEQICSSPFMLDWPPSLINFWHLNTMHCNGVDYSTHNAMQGHHDLRLLTKRKKMPAPAPQTVLFYSSPLRDRSWRVWLNWGCVCVVLTWFVFIVPLPTFELGTGAFFLAC